MQSAPASDRQDTPKRPPALFHRVPKWRIEAIRRRIEAGETARQIASRFGWTTSRVQAVIRRHRILMPPMRGRQLSAEVDREVRRLIESTDMAQREIAARAGCSLHAVGVRFREMRAKHERQLMALGKVAPKDGRRRCPEHGWVTVWPCVACAATSGWVYADG